MEDRGVRNFSPHALLWWLVFYFWGECVTHSKQLSEMLTLVGFTLGCEYT